MTSDKNDPLKGLLAIFVSVLALGAIIVMALT